MAGHSVDEYLETIYFLAFPIGEYRPHGTDSAAIASRVAEMLGVSRASAGEMLKRLEADGLVERGERKEAILTPAGIERAERVVRRHRIIERLLTDFMGYTPAESHHQADELGDTFTDDMIERINERLGTRIAARTAGPSSRPSSRRRTAASRRSPAAGRRPGEVVRLAEHDGDLLEWFTPRASSRAPASRCARRSRRRQLRSPSTARSLVSDKAAAGLYVRQRRARSEARSRASPRPSAHRPPCAPR